MSVTSAIRNPSQSSILKHTASIRYVQHQLTMINMQQSGSVAHVTLFLTLESTFDV